MKNSTVTPKKPQSGKRHSIIGFCSTANLTVSKMNDEIDCYGDSAKFHPGDRVKVLPSNMEATVIYQMKTYDYEEWYWGNVRLIYDDGIKGTCNSWQLEKL